MSNNCGGNEINLIQQYNPIVGKTEWKIVGSDYDCSQEIARSGYGDMLHDTDRNTKYKEAIKKAIHDRKLKNPNQQVHVLDIGTGTGLLSMMACEAGANKVTACEAFGPMAECASEILRENGFSDHVNLIPKRSTELTIDSDLYTSANVLVAELLDTELIGEAALSTYLHAAHCLISPDASLVPYAAEMYLQVSFHF